MMLSNHDVICTLVNIALLRQKILVSWCIVDSILDIRFHIDASSREESNSERCTFQIRSITRSHALRFDFTSYLKSIRVSNLDSFVFAIFTSMHDLDQDISRWKSLLGDFRQRIAEKAEIYIAEKVCTKASDSLEYRAEDTNDCCEKVLKIQFSQMCCNQNPVNIIWRKQN